MEISWGHSYETIPFSPTKGKGFQRYSFVIKGIVYYLRNCSVWSRLHFVADGCTL